MIKPNFPGRYPRQLLTLAVCVVAASAAQARAQDRLKVDLPSTIQLSKPDVLLGDVARVSGAALPQQLLLSNVFLGRMPSTGQSMTLEREALSRWIRQQTGLKNSQIQWTGATAIEVSWSKRRLSGLDITRVANDGLLRWLLERSERAELQATSEVADLVVPGADVQLRMRPINQAVPRERMVVWVDVFSGNRFLRAVPVTFNVAAWNVAYVATQSVSVGDKLRQESVRGAEVDMAKLPLRDATVAGQPLPLEETSLVKRALREGDIVTPTHIEPMPAVQRGGWALLQIGAGAVVLESRVQVSQDAKVGQSIRVKPKQSSEYVWARVKGPNLLELAQ